MKLSPFINVMEKFLIQFLTIKVFEYILYRISLCISSKTRCLYSFAMRWRLLASSPFVIKTGRNVNIDSYSIPVFPICNAQMEMSSPKILGLKNIFQRLGNKGSVYERNIEGSRHILIRKLWLKPLSNNDCHWYHPSCKQTNIFNLKLPVPSQDIFDSTVCSASNRDGSDAAYQNEKYLTTITWKGVFRQGVRMFASYTTRAEGSQHRCYWNY